MTQYLEVTGGMSPTSTKQGVEYEENGGRPNKQQDCKVDRR